MIHFRRAMILLMTALSISSFAGAQQKIAVLDFKAGAGVNQGDVDGISAIFGTYFIDSSKFTLVERTQIDRVISEQGFQQSSLTQQQMARIGQILNLSKIVVGDVNVVGGQYNVDVRVVDVQSGAVDATDGATWAKGLSYRELMSGLAGRLKTKMFPSASAVSTPSEPRPAMSASVVTLLGYLHVYPGELGEFPSMPWTVIARLNQQGMHGYNDWRVPTIEELALMKANAAQVGLGTGPYMTSDGTNSGIVRLVTTGKTVARQEEERAAQEVKLAAERQRMAEEARVREEEAARVRAERVFIAGVWWATRNVGSRGTFVDRPDDYGEFYTFGEAKSVCPEGWRTPTAQELANLSGTNPVWTSLNGVNGMAYGIGDNLIFLPAAGWSTNNNRWGGAINRGTVGSYWSSTEGNLLVSSGADLHFNNKASGVSKGSDARSYGSVRCVRK